MKKSITFLTIAVFMLAAQSAFSQSYKTIADSAALNREYAKVTADINDLTAKLVKAKDDQRNDSRKSGEADSDAKSTATSTSNKAENYINGSVKQARRAKHEAGRSVKDAKIARHAQSNLDDSNKKAVSLTAGLEQKQKRLQQLEEMRTAINAMQQ
jgi:type II secretory pathway component PulJ